MSHFSFAEYAQKIARYFDVLADLSTVDKASDILVHSYQNGGKALFCGNGGSAADAQHLAAEFVGRYQYHRPSIPAYALTVDTSALTAIANDYGYDAVFARQLSGLGVAGDVLVAISTSGNSPSVVEAVKTATEMQIKTIGLTGQGGGQLAELCDVCICVPSSETNHIQEMHIAVGHYLCGVVESTLHPKPSQ